MTESEFLETVDNLAIDDITGRIWRIVAIELINANPDQGDIAVRVAKDKARLALSVQVTGHLQDALAQFSKEARLVMNSGG